jgi:hypothetical protein
MYEDVITFVSGLNGGTISDIYIIDNDLFIYKSYFLNLIFLFYYLIIY